ncbi:hypothetical protein LCGC14_1659220 [marine sediment metagenome]|uniref:Uncharacterized protein n=1 Tax=marine sediment metagenome TaxID=412755 RepID=A0A0F9HVC1_9ZZZZ
MTPAQANPDVADFVTDVATQGPTDEGIRAADCWYVQNVLPAQPACVDCKGPIPRWAQQSLSTVRGESAGIGDQISLGGVAVRGFGIGVITPTFDSDRAITVTLGGSFTVPVGSSITVALPIGSQLWQSPGVVTSNAKVVAPSYPATTNGFVAAAPGAAVLTGTPGNGKTASVNVKVEPTAEAIDETEKKKIPTGVMVGAGVIGVVVIGGIVYAVTRR